ncbi:hypothetical protein MINTM021_25840 [Mycobacterium paraintracellulare]|nr:hypothetical protein MINTM021_25840 [Mycobacterium paraintracellulare]
MIDNSADQDAAILQRARSARAIAAHAIAVIDDALRAASHALPPCPICHFGGYNGHCAACLHTGYRRPTSRGTRA